MGLLIRCGDIRDGRDDLIIIPDEWPLLRPWRQLNVLRQAILIILMGLGDRLIVQCSRSVIVAVEDSALGNRARGRLQNGVVVTAAGEAVV